MGSAAATRYARAVFELAQQDGDLEAWRRRLEDVTALLEVPELHGALLNRGVPTEQRSELLREVGAGRLDAEALNLATLLLENGRIEEAGGVLAEFGAMTDEAEGRVRARVTTAVELDDAERQRIEQDLAARFGGSVRLEAGVDPAILGGLVLRVGDHVVDASVRTRLQQLRRRLASSAN